MIIIFAGCDCTGKSTQTGMFDKNIWEIRKGSANSDFKRSIDTLKSDIKYNKNVIYDRIPLIDDFVYTPVFANRESSYISYKDEASELLDKCVVIYLTCDSDVLVARMRSRGDNYISPDQIPIIKKWYHEIFNMLDLRPVTIDVTNLTEEEVANEIRRITKCM